MIAPIKYRPLLSAQTHHALVEVVIKIQNSASGLTVSKSSSILLKNEDIAKFQADEVIELNLENVTIQNVVQKQLNKVVQESTTPKLLYINKFVYIQVMGNKDITVSNADSYIKVQSDFVEQISATKLFLKIGDQLIESEPYDKFTFKLHQALYYNKNNTYLLLDDENRVIQQGLIVKS